MNRKIKAPHKEQEGWIYVRVKKSLGKPWYISPCWGGEITWPEEWNEEKAFYNDHVPGSRVVSSPRVEQALENDDYIKRCASEGLSVLYEPELDLLDGTTTWIWGVCGDMLTGWGSTVRGAYWMYKTLVDRAAEDGAENG